MIASCQDLMKSRGKTNDWSDNVRIVSLLLDKDPEPLKLAKDLIIGRPWDKLDHF